MPRRINTDIYQGISKRTGADYTAIKEAFAGAGESPEILAEILSDIADTRESQIILNFVTSVVQFEDFKAVNLSALLEIAIAACTPGAAKNTPQLSRHFIAEYGSVKDFKIFDGMMETFINHTGMLAAYTSPLVDIEETGKAVFVDRDNWVSSRLSGVAVAYDDILEDYSLSQDDTSPAGIFLNNFDLVLAAIYSNTAVSKQTVASIA